MQFDAYSYDRADLRGLELIYASSYTRVQSKESFYVEVEYTIEEASSRTSRVYVGEVKYFLKAVQTEEPSKVLRLAVADLYLAQRCESYLGSWLRVPPSPLPSCGERIVKAYPVDIEVVRRKLLKADPSKSNNRYGQEMLGYRMFIPYTTNLAYKDV